MEPPVVAVEWKGQEFEFAPKSSTWYWTIGILTVGCAVAAFIVNNILFGIIIILAGCTVSLLGSRRPALHTFKLTNRGVHVGEQVFTYENIKQFAIEESEPKKLLFELKHGLVSVMTIPLQGVDHRTIRMEFKNRSIEETEHLNTVVAHLSDWMGIG